MTDTFDTALFNKHQQGGLYSYTKADGTKVKMGGGREYYQQELAPSPSFLTTQKTFRQKTGTLIDKGQFLGFVKVGKWQFFDEDGHLWKETDEDKKFGRIGPQQIIHFLFRHKLVDPKTGKGFEILSIGFSDENGHKDWSVEVNADLSNGFKEHSWLIDGETGKVKKEESVQRGAE